MSLHYSCSISSSLFPSGTHLECVMSRAMQDSHRNLADLLMYMLSLSSNRVQNRALRPPTRAPPNAIFSDRTGSAMFISEERSESNAPAVADPSSSSLFEHECERAQLRASTRSQAGTIAGAATRSAKRTWN